MSQSLIVVASLNLVALGVLGIILSFLVQDRKKSLISLILSAVIVATGLYYWGSQAFSQMSMDRRMRAIQNQQKVDLDQLREKLRQQAAQPAPAASPAKKGQ